MLLAIPSDSGVLDSEVVEALAVPSPTESVVGDGTGASANVSDPVAVTFVSMVCVPDILVGSFADSVSSGAVDVAVSSDDAEVVLPVLSLLCQFIWIIGAKRLKAVILASALGTTWEATSLTFESSHVATDTVVDVATVKHV